MEKFYLGDGLFVSDDGYMIILSAPRQEGEHWVGLEPEVLDSLFHYIEKKRGVKITVEKAPNDNPEI